MEKITEKNSVLQPLEINIIELIALEKTNKEIADHFNYSTRMIELIISKLFIKFNVQSRTGLVIKSISYKIIPIPELTS